MAYPDLEESNQALRDSFARNQVTPAPAPDPKVPPYADQATATGFGVPVGADMTASSTPLFGEGGRLQKFVQEQSAANLAPAAPAASVPAQPPVITPAATSVRSPAANAPGVSTEGAIIRRAINEESTQPSATTPLSLSPPLSQPQMYQGDPNVIDAKYRAQVASADQSERDAFAGMRSDAAAAQATFDARNAERDAQVAKFAAVNGADMILRGGNKQQRQQIMRNAEIMSDRAAKAAERAGTISTAANAIGARNAIADNALTQEGINRAGLDSARAQGLTISAAAEKQRMEQMQQINKLGQVIASSGNPEERRRAQEAILAMLGKDKPEQYQVHVVNRPDTLGPDNMTVIRGGQDVVIRGPDGKVEVLSPDQRTKAAKQGGAKALPKTLAEYIAAMRSDPRNAKFSDAELAAEYAKQGGGR